MATRSLFRNWLEFGLVQILRVVFLSFPINLNLKTAKVIGRLWYWLHRKSRQTAIDNLRHAFPDKTDGEIQSLALQSMQNFVMTGIELLQSPRLISRWTWPKYAQLNHVDEVIRIVMSGRSAIMVTGHFGNFELLGQLVACFIGRFSAIARGMDNPLINRMLVQTRNHTGLNLIFKKGAMEAAEEVLNRGELLGFMADQNAGSKGVFVDFFGRKASTFKSVALLAIEYQVPVIVGCCRRINNRFQHELSTTKIIYPNEWQEQKNPIEWITQQFTSSIESFVRRWPEQYLWTHRRWKTRPKDELPSATQPNSLSTNPVNVF